MKRNQVGCTAGSLVNDSQNVSAFSQYEYHDAIKRHDPRPYAISNVAVTLNGVSFRISTIHDNGISISSIPMRKYFFGIATLNSAWQLAYRLAGTNMRYVKQTPNCMDAIPNSIMNANGPKARRASSGYVNSFGTNVSNCRLTLRGVLGRGVVEVLLVFFASESSVCCFCSCCFCSCCSVGVMRRLCNSSIRSARNRCRLSSTFQHAKRRWALYTYANVANTNAGIATAQPASLNPRGKYRIAGPIVPLTIPKMAAVKEPPSTWSSTSKSSSPSSESSTSPPSPPAGTPADVSGAFPVSSLGASNRSCNVP